MDRLAFIVDLSHKKTGNHKQSFIVANVGINAAINIKHYRDTAMVKLVEGNVPVGSHFIHKMTRSCTHPTKREAFRASGHR